MTLERRSVNYKSIFAREGKFEGITTAPHPVDRSKAYNVDNHGELTTGEYNIYLDYLKNNPELRRAGRFPPVKPTREQYSGLVKKAEDLGLDFGNDSDVDLDLE